MTERGMKVENWVSLETGVTLYSRIRTLWPKEKERLEKSSNNNTHNSFPINGSNFFFAYSALRKQLAFMWCSRMTWSSGLQYPLGWGLFKSYWNGRSQTKHCIFCSFPKLHNTAHSEKGVRKVDEAMCTRTDRAVMEFWDVGETQGQTPKQWRFSCDKYMVWIKM